MSYFVEPIQSAKAEANAVRVARIVVVDVAIVVDTAEVAGITDVRRTKPPVVRRAAQTIITVCNLW